MNTHLILKSVAITSALIFISACGEKTDKPKTQQPISISIIKETTQSHDIRFSGELESQNIAKLSFRVPGTLEKIFVQQGDTIHKGQVIAQLDRHDYQTRVNELAARLIEAKASHQQALNELSRTQLATQGKAIADVNLERAETAVKRAAAAVKVVNENYKQAQDALNYTTLTAPFDGMVAKRYSEEFEQVTPGIPFITIHQPNNLQAVIDIPESKLSQIYQGQEAIIESDLGHASIKGTVTEISTLPNPIKRTFSATVTLPITEQLFPGKVVNVRVKETSLPEGTTCLPASAVFSLKGQPTVAKVKSEHIQHTEVQIVKQTRNTLCVIGEVRVNDTIITAGASYLADGTKITNVVNKDIIL